MQILRRHLLLALAASPWLSHASAAAKTTSANVIVLGAGMSGLNCARELRQMGYNVIVLEARDRTQQQRGCACACPSEGF